MNKQIVFTGINKAELLDSNYPQISDDGIIVKTAFSAISSGTERANISGDPNNSIHSDGKVVFPRYSGYSSSGEVVEIGKNIKDVQIGDHVAMCWTTHSKYNAVSCKNYVKLPKGVSLQEAALCHIGTFPLAALRKTRLEIGESVMIMGLGILGMMAVSFAKAMGGVPIIAVDLLKERRELAIKYGADYTLDPTDNNFVDKVKEITNGGVKVAIEVTGSGAGLNECLDCMKKFGRIALLGCTRDKNFTVDYYRKVHGPGITLLGAHTVARPDFESSYNAFTLKDDMKTVIQLLQNNRIEFKDKIERIYSPNDCTDVYNKLVNDKKFPVCVEFDWSKL